MKRLAFLISFALIISSFVGPAAAIQTVNVPGTSDPWLAGMPDGSTASYNPGSMEPADVAPAESPVLVSGIVSGMNLTWTATGLVGHPGDITDPDGSPIFYNVSHYGGAEHGISDITVPIDSLLGVFLGPSQPDPSSPPIPLDFSTSASRDYLMLLPALQQVFFMGDGLTDGGMPQTIVAPLGATRLYLGTMDAYSWNNNVGSFDVTISAVPEPSTLLLLGAGLAGVGLMRRKLRK